MNIEKQMVVARDPETPCDVLEDLLGLNNVDLNRCLAGHPNADDYLLSALCDWSGKEGFEDVLTRRAVVQNPNVSTDIFVLLSAEFPELALKNTMLRQRLQADHEWIWLAQNILEHTACPDDLIAMALANGDKSLQMNLLRNPALPEATRHALMLQNEAKATYAALDSFQVEYADETTRRLINAYRDLAVPRWFCIPVYKCLDMAIPENRLGDQLISAFPFTSASWPWPVDDAGGYMQPLAQIDLALAGQLLDVPLGDGLLQMWIAVSKDLPSEAHFAPVVRVVPTADLDEPMHSFYPDNPPWNEARACGDTGACVFALSRKVVPWPSVRWVRVGQMFPSPVLVLNRSPSANDDGSVVLDEVADAMEAAGVLTADTSALDAKSKLIRLGGYPRASGNEADLVDWVGTGNHLLLYLTEEEGIFTLALRYRISRDGQVEFDASISTDN